MNFVAHLDFGHHKYTYDESKQSDGAGENFNDQNLDEQRRVCRIRQGGSAADDSYANSAQEINHS